MSRMIKVSAQTAMAKSERGDSFRDTFTEHEWKVLTSNLYNYAHNRGKFKDERANKQTDRKPEQTIFEEIIQFLKISTGSDQPELGPPSLTGDFLGLDGTSLG